MAERSQEQLQRQFSPSSDHLLKVVDLGAPQVSKKVSVLKSWGIQSEGSYSYVKNKPASEIM